VSSIAYNLGELAIANNPGDARRCLPVITAAHRRVLDVGCGAGQTLAACRLGPEVEAYGVDLDREAIELGRRLHPSIRFVRCCGESLPFASAGFDLVICRVALPYMDVARALAEMARVLRPGGDLWLALRSPRAIAQRALLSLRQGYYKDVVFQAYVACCTTSVHYLGKSFRWPFGKRYESAQLPSSMRRLTQAVGMGEVCIRERPHFIVTARRRPSL
jgi:ubiquinone/menaquinone biosynthesis C-methylase UbiE